MFPNFASGDFAVIESRGKTEDNAPSGHVSLFMKVNSRVTCRSHQQECLSGRGCRDEGAHCVKGAHRPVGQYISGIGTGSSQASIYFCYESKSRRACYKATVHLSFGGKQWHIPQGRKQGP